MHLYHVAIAIALGTLLVTGAILAVLFAQQLIGVYELARDACGELRDYILLNWT